jgi:hypothetical protein
MDESGVYADTSHGIQRLEVMRVRIDHRRFGIDRLKGIRRPRTRRGWFITVATVAASMVVKLTIGAVVILFLAYAPVPLTRAGRIAYPSGANTGYWITVCGGRRLVMAGRSPMLRAPNGP